MQPYEALPFKLPRPVIADAGHLAESAASLGEIAATAVSLLSSVPFQDYPRAIAKELKVSPDSVGAAIASLREFRRMQHALDLGPEEFLSRLTMSLHNDAPAKWKAKYLTQWSESQEVVKDVLQSLVADHPLVLLWKSEDLSGAYENLLGESVIITDIRPVFNRAEDKVVQTVISHTLLIDYLCGSEQKRIQFALDATDVADLREACERAKSKSDSIRAAMPKLGWPTSVPRDTDGQ
jgi:hypothetical protein